MVVLERIFPLPFLTMTSQFILARVEENRNFEQGKHFWSKNPNCEQKYRILRKIEILTSSQTF